RAAFRRERDAERAKLASDLADADRLRREAIALRRAAARDRERVKRLAARFVRRHRQKTADARTQARAERAASELLRARLTDEERDLGRARAEFHAAAADDRERRREAWAAIEAQQRRAVAERTEANDYYAKQEALLDARAADLDAREKALAGSKGVLEKETAGLRQEAAGLEARIQHAR